MDTHDAEEETKKTQAAKSDKEKNDKDNDNDEESASEESKSTEENVNEENNNAQEQQTEQGNVLALLGPVVLTLEGTHTGATETESNICIVPKEERHVSFQQVVEECPLLSPSTTKVVENVREYVKQIEKVLELEESCVVTTRAPPLSAALVVETPKATLQVEQVKSDSEKPELKFGELEQTQLLEEAERAEHKSDKEKMSAKLPDLKQVEMENQEIAERFKQIMEMFDNFTKNLESLEMPAMKDKEARLEEKEKEKREPPQKQEEMPTVSIGAAIGTPDVARRRRRLSFKGIQELEVPPAVHGGSRASAAGTAYNEFYRELHGERISDEATSVPKAEPNSSISIQTLREVSFIEPTVRRDIATTCSGLELTQWPSMPPMRPSVRMATIACQTSQFEYFAMLPNSDSSSFSTSRSEMHNEGGDCHIETFILDSTARGANSACANVNDVCAAAKKPSVVELPPLTMAKLPDSPTLVEFAEPPAMTIGPAAAAAAAANATGDAPCERTFHTIHIEATSSPSSSVMHRPPLCMRMWNVITDFCAAVCLCLQVNKDCLFCFGFFVAFVVSASFLTAFFYHSLSIDPQLFELVPPQTNVEQVTHALQLRHRDFY